MRPVPDIMPPPAVAPTTKEIPYDYVAKFKLQGKPGNRVQDVINISVEGGFVAVAIGYSFIPTLPAPLPEILVSAGSGGVPPPSTTTLVEIIANTIADAFTLGRADATQTESQLATIIQPFVDPRVLTHCLLVRVCGIDFKYSIVDSGTGRELQNQPIHNIAGLGRPRVTGPFAPSPNPCSSCPARPSVSRSRKSRRGRSIPALSSSSCCTATRCWATGRRCHERKSCLRRTSGYRLF